MTSSDSHAKWLHSDATTIGTRDNRTHLAKSMESERLSVHLHPVGISLWRLIGTVGGEFGLADCVRSNASTSLLTP